MLAIHGRSRSAIASMASKRYHAQSIARPIPLKPLAWDSQEQLPGFPLQSNSSLRSQFLARWRSYRFPEYRPHSIWHRRAAPPCLHRPADTVAISQLSSVLLSVARPRHRGAAWGCVPGQYLRPCRRPVALQRVWPRRNPVRPVASISCSSVYNLLPDFD